MNDLLMHDHEKYCSGSRVTNTFVRPFRRIPAVIYKPAERIENSDIAILVMHSDEDYLSFSAGEELAARGYTVMCANVSSKTADLDRRIKDVNIVMDFLKKTENPKKILLLGHSGGATLMSAYQSIAENGPSVFQKNGMLKKCPDDMTGLAPADGLLLLDSNWGNAAMFLFSLDPSVTDENDSHSTDFSLDIFNPDNGFEPGGSTYPDGFVKAFFKGQHDRSLRLNEHALARIRELENGTGNFDDDEPMVISGAEQGFFNNKLYAQDIRFMSRTRKPHTLLHGDGSETTEIIHSLRNPENDISFTQSYSEGAQITSVKAYISLFALRTDEDYGYDESTVYGIDWDSNYNCTTGNIKHLNCPLLIMGMTGGWEFAASETIFDNAASPDKTLAYVKGADHFFRPCKHLEKIPGQFGDTTKITYDYVDKWIRARF